MLVSTGTVSNILTTTADVSGKILDLGNGATQYGHCYSKTTNPTIADTKIDHSSPALGDYTSALEGLEAGTKYYVKAYLSRGNNVVYGNEINFTTASAALPELTTNAITTFTKTTAVSGGNITNQGGTPVTARGVCWSLATITTLTNNKTTDGTGIGIFNSDITGLTPGTNYYLRAYATNSGGTKLGNEVTFTTTSDTPVPPTVATANVTSVTSSSAVCGGEVTNEGSASVTAKGVCWSKIVNPLTLNSTTTNGTGLGSFISNITGLDPGTKYYVRAYATSSAGTAYGTEYNFTTNAVVPTLNTITVNSITSTSANSGGDITNLGGSDISGKGVCWSMTSPPTISDTKTSDGPTSVLGNYMSYVAGLIPEKTYHIRAYATNSAGTSYGNELTFATPCLAPTSISNDPTLLTNLTATLNGTVNANSNGCSTTVTFEYGTTTSYDKTINASPNSVIGTSATAVSAAITGLVSGQTYHFRVKAVSTVGTTNGDDKTFKTTVKDNDANVYTTITIGTQVWMGENLKTTKYNNGTSIPLVGDANTWINLYTPGFCWYNNDAGNYSSNYGALYNWYAVNMGKLCPAGWHVPTDVEWHTLMLFLDVNTTYNSGIESLIAGGKLKETGTTHWISPNYGATKESGFSALPGGCRGTNGVFTGTMGYSSYWWLATEGTTTLAWSRNLSYLDAKVYYLIYPKIYGFSVRCLRDN